MSNPESNEPAHRAIWLPPGISFDEATERLPGALQAEGFGIITQIDLQQTFKAKLEADFRRYPIFGACNPGFALKAVKVDPRAGVLLPCNVVLFERDDGVAVLGVIDPVRQLNAPPGPLAQLAHEIGTRFTRVGQSLASLQPLGGIG